MDKIKEVIDEMRASIAAGSYASHEILKKINIAAEHYPDQFSGHIYDLYATEQRNVAKIILSTLGSDALDKMRAVVDRNHISIINPQSEQWDQSLDFCLDVAAEQHRLDNMYAAPESFEGLTHSIFKGNDCSDETVQKWMAYFPERGEEIISKIAIRFETAKSPQGDEILQSIARNANNEIAEAVIDRFDREISDYNNINYGNPNSDINRGLTAVAEEARERFISAVQRHRTSAGLDSFESAGDADGQRSALATLSQPENLRVFNSAQCML